VELQMPNQWQEVADFAVTLSAQDPDYDYQLPTRAQWSFACMNGYDQTCPGRGANNANLSTASKRPNKYGIDGFMNYDVECSNVPGLFLGQYDNWDNGREIPECRCHQSETGSPDSDDSLDELIVGRFVLVPTSTSSAVGR
jgi:formylglycine-generating enzyme required for sulfatase activity